VKCLCKEISFLIFQEGNIIITGGRYWEQLLDGYNVITNIIKKEYQHIVVEKISKSVESYVPAQIVKYTPDGRKITYLNKKKQIMENPRNLFLLKKIGLLDKYASFT
jgi:TATA-box binding protein (TBP) (component of TFIID and TFIIIB)